MKIKNISIAVAGSVLALSLAQTVSAQGTININSYDAAAGFFIGSTSTAAPVDGSVFVELLGGSAANSLTGVVSANTGLAINTLTDSNGNGAGTGSYFDVGNGGVTGVANNALGYFQIIAWSGNANYAQATYQFASAVWSENVGTAQVGATPANPTTLNISFATPVQGSLASLGGGNEALILTSVPEPSSLALAGLGGLGMLMAMRRKKA